MTRPEKRRRGAKKQQRMLILGGERHGVGGPYKIDCPLCDAVRFMLRELSLLGIIKKQQEGR